MEVSVESEVSAYTVFKTLNARGLELTASDLIKNYLMSHAANKGRGDLRYILNRWTRMTNRIGARRLPNFLRHYFNSVAPYVRQERLFRQIRTRVTTGQDAIDLVTELERAAICYRALDDANDEYYDNGAWHGWRQPYGNCRLDSVTDQGPSPLAVYPCSKNACTHLAIGSLS
jgi:hypothetical protein